MMRLARPLALSLALLAAAPAVAEDLVVTLSTREVAITSTYTGAEITAFGVIERDGRTIARSGRYDIVVSVQGPSGDVQLQQKSRFGPIWLTDQRRRFARIPLFLAVLSSAPLREITDENVRQSLRLGLDHFLPSIGRVSASDDLSETNFRAALLRLREAERSLMFDPSAVTMVRPNVFSARIALPATAPTGLYVAHVSLLADGLPLKTVQAGFVVRKVGFDAFVAESARNASFAYGAATLIMAVLLGWMANLIFRRD